jgi:hypothetical protein
MPEPALHLAVMQALADNPHVHADEIGEGTMSEVPRPVRRSAALQAS